MIPRDMRILGGWKNTDPLYKALVPLVVDLGRDELKGIGFSIVEEAPEEIKAILIAAFLQLAMWKQTNIEEIEQAILVKAGMTMQNLYDAVKQSNIGVWLLSKGEVKGEAKAVRRQWAKRFGVLSADVDTALQAATTETLEHILDQFIEPTYTVEQAWSDLGVSA